MKIFIFLVAVVSILERNGTFQVEQTKTNISEEERAINTSKTFLMFQQFQPILESIVHKYGDFEKLGRMASECHEFISTATDVINFDVILYGIQTEAQMKQIIRKIPDTNNRQLYLEVLPKVITLMDQFLVKVSLLRPNEDVDIKSKIESWKMFTKNLLTQPLSPSGVSCFQLTNLIEHNSDLFTLYLRGMQEAPQAVLEETALMLVKSTSVADLFNIDTKHEKVFHKIEKEIMASRMTIPDPEMEKKDLKIYEMELKQEKSQYAKFFERSVGSVKRMSSNAFASAKGYLKKKPADTTMTTAQDSQ